MDLEHLFILNLLERKRKERTCFVYNQLETSHPNKGKAYGSHNVYSENRGYPGKYKQLFNFIYLITGPLRKLWYRIRKTAGKINGKMKIC